MLYMQLSVFNGFEQKFAMERRRAQEDILRLKLTLSFLLFMYLLFSNDESRHPHP